MAMTFFNEVILINERTQKIRVCKADLPIHGGSIIRIVREETPVFTTEYGENSAPSLCPVAHWKDTKEVLLRDGFVIIERD